MNITIWGALLFGFLLGGTFGYWFGQAQSWDEAHPPE